MHLCPIPKEQQLHRVLDVGTGTGIWAIDFGKNFDIKWKYETDITSADEHPESQVGLNQGSKNNTNLHSRS